MGNFFKSVKVSSTQSTQQINKIINLNELEFKIILLGDSNVGKSSLIDRFRNNNDVFSLNNQTTIGINKIVHYFPIILDNVNKVIKIIILDSFGNSRFDNITETYCKNIDGAVIVYDDVISYNNINKWLNMIRKANNVDNFDNVVGKTHINLYKTGP
jgi:small GTP-binding protein